MHEAVNPDKTNSRSRVEEKNEMKLGFASCHRSISTAGYLM